MANQMLTPKEVASMMHCCTATVKRMVAARRLRAIRLGGPRGHLRIPASAVDALQKAGSEVAGQNPGASRS